MKIKNKRYLYLLIFSFFIGIFTFITPLNAERYTGYRISPEENIPGLYIRKQGANGKVQNRYAHFMRRSSDAMFVYCLEPLEDIDNNYIYDIYRTDYTSVLNITSEQWRRISMLAYYGYNYGNHTDPKWYMITQIMIWRTIQPYGSFEFTDSYGGTIVYGKFSEEMAEIENLLLQHESYPEFDKEEIVVPLGQTITINDTNNVLNKFRIYSARNVNASINGNTLSITATGLGDAIITFIKDDDLYETPPIVYYNQHSQNVMSVGSLDPLYDNISIKVIGGRVELTKKDKYTGEIIPQGLASLENATYGVYNATTDELVGTLTTNENAYAISDYLPTLGRFYLKEITPSLGYKLDNQKYYFTIDENDLLVHVDVYEEVITRDYEITKVYASDKTQIMTPEVGVQFAIYNHNNNLVSIETTDNEGKIYFSLPYGNYRLHQLTTTSGFEKIEDYYFEVRDLGPSINKVFSNSEIISRVKVVKVDQDNNVITRAGIKFKIKDLKTGNYVCQTISYPTVTTYCEFETDDSGVLITPYPLNSGNYQLEEVDQVVFGYVWNSTPLEFSIDENSNIESTDEFDNIIELHFTNQEVLGSIEIIKTGEKVIIENKNYTYVSIPLPNVVFGLYDENGTLVTTVITDENGYAKIENIKLGNYILKELETSMNHVLDDKEYKITLEYVDQYTPIVSETFTLKNYIGKGELDFTKTDLTSGKVIPNVKIDIFTENDELIFSGITDENGKVVLKNLFIGKFYIVETDPATGYKLNEEKVLFEIKENGEVVKATMTNEKYTGNLELTKVDLSTGDPIPNVLFEIYNADNDELIFSGRTDENGKIIINELEYGKYYILEKEAPIGYILNNEKMYFEILEDGEIVKTTITNEKVEMPKTFNTDFISFSIIISTTLLGVGVLLYAKKKNK